MKLAEALIKRADLKNRIAQISSRMTENVLVMEGDELDEDIAELQMQYDSAMNELEEVIIRINKTNNETLLDGETSLAAAITKRDCVNLKSLPTAH
jgi:seryl-tRNA synthetase